MQLFVSSAIGGETVGETVEGVARYPINIRYPQDYRNSPQALKEMPILTPMKQQITLGMGGYTCRFRPDDAENGKCPTNQLDLY